MDVNIQNNKNITLLEMKKIEVGILEQIHNICKKNNLKYSLMDGSLIGAIRHQGFIPWDDDIDIMMPRPDYEKLKRIMCETPIENLKYLSSDVQEDYYLPYAKVVYTKTTIKECQTLEIKDYGVFIDIFPIDAIYDNELKRFLQMKMVAILRIIIRISSHEKQISKSKIKKVIKNIISFFIKVVGYKKWVRLTQKIMQKCNYGNTKYVTSIYSDISIKKGKFYTRDMFEKIIQKPFENKEFYVIEKYDKYLTDLFGDYMTPPPIEKQISNHEFDRLMWKE